MKKFLLALAVVAGLGACTDKSNAQRILSQQGYTEIQLGGYAFGACSEDDTYATSFRAKSPAGIFVEGAVCSGWFKGGTIRFY